MTGLQTLPSSVPKSPREFGCTYNRIRAFIRAFGPSWFVITMGTGSAAISLGNFPFPFPGQQGIALAVWCLNVVLFALALSCVVSRAVLYSASLHELLEHPNQSLFIGTVPMSISVITGGMLVILAPWCGPPAVQACYVLAWANLPVVLLTALVVPFYMFSSQEHSVCTMTTLWLVPVIPGTAAAAVTGAISKSVLHADQAVPLLVPGLCMLAVSFPLSYHVLTIYYQRLICYSLPPREVIVSSFIPVGAVGMAGWALLNLASAADKHMRAFHTNILGEQRHTEWLEAVLPTSVAAAGVAGLGLWAYAGWWLLLAICSVRQAMRQGIPFNLGYWGSVFPVGTFAGTAVTLGRVFHSNPFQVIGASLSCIHVAVWLFVASMTVYRGIIRGELFHAPCLAPPTGATAEPGAECAESLPQTAATCSADLQALEAKLSTPPSVLVPAESEVQYLREQLAATAVLLQGLSGRYDAAVAPAHMSIQSMVSSLTDERGVHGHVHRVPGILYGCQSADQPPPP